MNRGCLGYRCYADYSVLMTEVEGGAEEIPASSADDEEEMDPRGIKTRAAMLRMFTQQDDKMDKRLGALDTTLERRLEAKMAKTVDEELLALRAEADWKLAAASVGLGGRTGSASAPQVKRTQPLESASTGTSTRSSPPPLGATLSEHSDKLVWTTSSGAERLPETAKPHYDEVVRPNLPEFLRDIVEFRCRAFCSQYFRAPPMRARRGAGLGPWATPSPSPRRTARYIASAFSAITFWLFVLLVARWATHGSEHVTI